ncbi:MAG TPA: septation protein SepH [Actinomycetota bacterium]
MIKLRLIGSSADLKHLVYSNKRTGKKGSHLVAIDDGLFDVLEDVVRRRRRGEAGDDEDNTPRPVAPRVQSKLPPREVQRLLRAGRTPEQVAKAADVPIAWVEQFLVPVLYERQGMVREAQRAWLSKQRLGESGLSLGEAVVANLRSRHVRLGEGAVAGAWDATRTEGQPWTISLRFRFRGREQRATWKYDPARRSVTAANRLAADLGWVAPGRRVRTAERTSRFVSPESHARREAAATEKPARKRTVAKKRAPAKRRTVAKKRAPAKRRTPAKRRVVAKKRAPAKRRVVAKKRAPVKRRTATRRRARR